MTAVRLAFIGEGQQRVLAVPRHAHAHPIVIWYTQGNGRLIGDDGRVHAFARDTVALVPAGVHYREQSRHGFISLYFALEHFVLRDLAVVRLDEDPRFRLAARLLLEESRRSADDQLVLLPALAAVLQALTRLQALGTYSVLVEQMFELIHAQSEDAQFTIARGCRRLGVSPRQLRRAFAREVGTTPVQYLLGWRIAQAGRLLHGGGFPVQEVAWRCGFLDPYYFARVFRRFTGASPSAYRLAASARQR
jgi:AraC-like DNA-binding protein